jgi:hypothetical protein
MINETDRLELWIDVLDKTAQRAQVLPTITSAELIAAILQEFQELEYLTDDPAGYQLVRTDATPLVADQTLGEQVAQGERLLLVECIGSIPPGRQAAGQPLYLCEVGAGRVFRLAWLPALIGRPDAEQANGEPLAVNLEGHSAGLRVSRRHAQIVERAGQYWLESLSSNPTALVDSQGNSTPVSASGQSLRPGDLIQLERSGIVLKFIVRET